MNKIIPLLCIIAANEEEARELNEAGIAALPTDETLDHHQPKIHLPDGWAISQHLAGGFLLTRKTAKWAYFQITTVRGIVVGVGSQPTYFHKPYPSDGKAVYLNAIAGRYIKPNSVVSRSGLHDQNKKDGLPLSAPPTC